MGGKTYFPKSRGRDNFDVFSIFPMKKEYFTNIEGYCPLLTPIDATAALYNTKR
jgi:hypothetical protein